MPVNLILLTYIFVQLCIFNYLFISSPVIGIINPQSSKTSIFRVKEKLFDFSKPYTLGLQHPKGMETFTVYTPLSEKDTKYNHGIVLYPFKGYLFAQWQTSERDEDAEDTHVLYSKSKNGKDWSSPSVLAVCNDNGIATGGGWWSFEDSLIAFINIWPERKNPRREGYAVYKISADGINWSKMKRIVNIDSFNMNGIIEQDPHILPNGRIITAFHEQPGLILSPYFTDDPKAVSGWSKGIMENLPYDNFISRELEPSLFCRPDKSIVMVFRDQGGSYKQLASVSLNNGVSWSQPSITNMPDSRSKQSAGNLPSGAVFMVNNPSGNKNRYPLAITLSYDGYYFNKSYLIRGGDDIPSMKHWGKYKRQGFSYPKSVVWQDFLYVGYATNKEDIQVTRIPLESFY